MELLEIQHTPPHVPSPPAPCALPLRCAARPHLASSNFCHHLPTPSSQATITLPHATATVKGQEQEMEEEESPWISTE